MTKSLVLREVRGHLFLAAGILAAGIAACWIDLIARQAFSSNPMLRGLFLGGWGIPDGGSYTLLRGTLLWPLFLLSSVGGVLLGVFLVYADSRAGVEAMLLHLPVSRIRIFFAKYLAGAILLAGGLLPPFLVRALWTATPGGHLGPFAWEMAYPGLTEIAVSFPALAAGLWLGYGRGRERLLGIAALLDILVAGALYSSVGIPPKAEIFLAAGTAILLLGGITAHRRREI